jgi:tetratricopeptide (TPR) repeat protein
MALTVLDRAERLFNSARHAELISLLEPQVPVYRDSARFYYLLGASCLRTGDIGGAATYLKRAESLAPLDIDVLLALSALEVRRGDSKKAVDGYLRVLELKPGERRAIRGLNILRTEGGPEGLAALVSSGRIQSLYPGAGSLRPLFRGALRLIPAILIAAAVGFGLYRAAQGISVSRRTRPEVAAVSLSSAERNSPVTTSGSFRYALTEAEVISSFEKAKRYFQDYRDNAAVIEINRILGSNASSQIKAKAATLKNFVGKPDFRTVKDVPAFSEVASDPWLYDGCSVVWKGMAANVQERGGVVSFDFLVGYHEKNRLEGIAKARIAEAAVPLDRPLELLATLSTSGGTVFLEGSAIHELGITGR